MIISVRNTIGKFCIPKRRQNIIQKVGSRFFKVIEIYGINNGVMLYYSVVNGLRFF